jgi:hypothetical protein
VISRPQQSQAFYRGLFSGAPAAATSGSYAANLKAAIAKFGRVVTPARIAKALSIGIPLAMLASYFADQDSGKAGDEGYYDDYVEDGDGFDGDGDGFDDGMGDGGMGDGGMDDGGVPSDLAPSELAWYLQSGNLPERYMIRRGRGKLQITHGDEDSDEGMEGGMVTDMRYRSPQELAMREYQQKLLESRGVGMPIRSPAPPTTGRPPRQPVLPPRQRAPRQVPVPPREATPEEIAAMYSETPVEGSGRRSDGRAARAAIVRKVMQERGVKLGEASKIVKAEGLY